MIKFQIYFCLNCKKEFERRIRKIGPYKFCSRQCSNSSKIIKRARSYLDLYDRWEKLYGKSIANKMLDDYKIKRSKIVRGVNNPRYGKLVSKQVRQKISKSCIGNSNVLKGKTFKEFYGISRARELSEAHSKKLKEGYASGRLTPSKPSSERTKFRGIQLRSKLERDVIEFLEIRDNLIFGETLLYEDKSIRVQWVDSHQNKHTYIPDLLDIINNIIYEVKPYWMIKSESDEMFRKRLAASQLGTYMYISDVDIRKN